ncbi:heparinase II/III family protein [Enterocloster aldenensis]|uniref:heparinase II/III domain-containing protein n=1 Tax=Enterocloster aldenensis TaxID=358742 RepID=UPI004029B6DC
MGQLGAGLFFDSRYIDTIKDRTGDGRYRGLWTGIRDTADRIADNGSLMWEGDTFTIWYYVRNRLMDLALSVMVEGQERHIKALNHILMTLCKEDLEFWQGPQYPNRPRTILYHEKELPAGELETAQLAMGISIAYDWGYGYLSEECRDMVQHALREKAIPLLYNSACFQAENWVMNHLCVISAGLMLASLVMDDRNQFKEQIEAAKKGLSLWMGKIEDDGSYGESYHYWAYPVNCLFFGLYAAKVVLGEEIPGTWRMGRALNWAIYNQVGIYRLEGFGKPVAVAVNQYDCPYVFQMEAPEALLFSRIFKMPLAQWYINTFLLSGLDRPDGLHHVWHTCSSLLLALDDDTLPARSPHELGMSASAYFADTGFVYLRDSWKHCGELGGDTVLALQSGGGGRSSSHEHYDKNSICLYAKGEYFLVDPGHSCYRGNAHRVYDTSTAAHNTLNVGGRDQNLEFLEAGMLFDEARACRSFQNQAYITGRNFAEHVSYVSSDAHRCYKPELNAFVRKVWYVRPDYFVIWDHVDVSNVVGELNNGFNINQSDGKSVFKEWGNELMVERPLADLKIEYIYPALSGFDKEDARLHTAYHILPDQKVEGKPGSAVRFTPRPADHKARCVDYVWILNVHRKSEAPVRIKVLDEHGDGTHFSSIKFEVHNGNQTDTFTLSSENGGYENNRGERYCY